VEDLLDILRHLILLPLEQLARVLTVEGQRQAVLPAVVVVAQALQEKSLHTHKITVVEVMVVTEQPLALLVAP
jgi:hypothetical protein